MPDTEQCGGQRRDEVEQVRACGMNSSREEGESTPNWRTAGSCRALRLLGCQTATLLVPGCAVVGQALISSEQGLMWAGWAAEGRLSLLLFRPFQLRLITEMAGSMRLMKELMNLG